MYYYLKKEPKKYLIEVVYIYSFKYFTFNINNLKSCWLFKSIGAKLKKVPKLTIS